MVHGVNVLKKINYVPNFLICVPSSSNFNENFINKFSKQLGGCKSYKAFMIKNWLGYSLSEEDKQKIRQHLSYIKNMSGEDKWNDTVNVMEYTIKKGITNTFLYMISKNITANLDVNKYNSSELTNILHYIFYQILQRENGEKLSQFLTGVTPNINRIKTKAKEILKTINKQHRGIFEYILSKIDKKYILHNNSKLEKQYGNIINKIIMDSESTLLQHLPNEQNKSNPIQINLNQITYKDTDVQMTSLFWGGVMSDGSYRDDKKVTSQLPGKELRPLMVSVYLVNKKEYVLTKEGEELINDLKTYQDIPLNETEKVEITNRKMMIFDDDMDTGASLKLELFLDSSDIKDGVYDVLEEERIFSIKQGEKNDVGKITGSYFKQMYSSKIKKDTSIVCIKSGSLVIGKPDHEDRNDFTIRLLTEQGDSISGNFKGIHSYINNVDGTAVGEVLIGDSIFSLQRGDMMLWGDIFVDGINYYERDFFLGLAIFVGWNCFCFAVMRLICFIKKKHIKSCRTSSGA